MCCAHSPVRADRIQQSTKRLPCPSNFSELRIFEKWLFVCLCMLLSRVQGLARGSRCILYGGGLSSLRVIYVLLYRVLCAAAQCCAIGQHRLCNPRKSLILVLYTSAAQRLCCPRESTRMRDRVKLTRGHHPSQHWRLGRRDSEMR